MITRVRTDSVVIRESITALFNFIQSFIFIFGITYFLVFLEPTGFTILYSIFVDWLFCFTIHIKKITEMGKIRQEFEISRTKKLQESFSGIKEIKTFR